MRSYDAAATKDRTVKDYGVRSNPHVIFNDYSATARAKPLVDNFSSA